MTQVIVKPTEIQALGNKPKIIQEYRGRVNSKTEKVSIAKMNNPEAWIEPEQTSEFDEYSFVLNGMFVQKQRRKRL